MTEQRLQDVYRGLMAYNLTQDDKRWLARKLLDNHQPDDMSPYTVEELFDMVEKGRQQIEEGLCYTTEEVLAVCQSDIMNVEA